MTTDEFKELRRINKVGNKFQEIKFDMKNGDLSAEDAIYQAYLLASKNQCEYMDQLDETLEDYEIWDVDSKVEAISFQLEQDELDHETEYVEFDKQELASATGCYSNWITTKDNNSDVYRAVNIEDVSMVLDEMTKLAHEDFDWSKECFEK